MVWIWLIIFVFTILYFMLKKKRRFWADKGVRQSNGSIFGDNLQAAMRKQTFPDMVQMAYNMFPNTRYSGFYQFFTPALILRDPDLIKQITVKDFDHFLNHRSFVPEDADPLFSKNLFSLKNQKWREMRTTMSPVFTSSKMRYMFLLILQNAEQFVQYFLRKKEDIVTVELKDIFTRFTNDVIASTVFGIEINSLAHPKNEFYLAVKELTDFSKPLKIIKFFGGFVAPKLYSIFKISPFSTSACQFLANIIQNNIESRRKNNIVRPDMINILLEAQKYGMNHDDSSSQDIGFATVEESEVNIKSKAKMTITDEDIISQGTAFFFAGFETVAGLMCFTAYELGVNPEIQEKLIREVDETLEVCNSKITYEALLGMKYMDQVVSESLRKWPNAALIDRLCSKSYTIEPKYADEKPLHLEKDTSVFLPIFGIHRDPKYYPDPDRFDPERFNDENKGNIKPYTYLPFGIGPRNCLGSRFALLETKCLFFNLLKNFEIVPVEKSPIPLRISLKQLNMTAEGGFWFGLKKRFQ